MQKRKEQPSHDHSRKPNWAPALVLLLSLVATVLATYSVRLTSRARDDIRLKNSMRWAQDIIEERLNIYMCGLVGGAALFAAHEQPTHAEFQAYAERLNLHKVYPGIQGFGYARRTPPDSRVKVVEQMRSEVISNFSIRPPGDRQECYPVVYLEPMDIRNDAALGFDMYSEEVRREAMAYARDQGKPTASGKVILVQEIDAEAMQPGFLLYVPVYRGGKVPATREARREQILGFVYSPFRAHDLFAGIFHQEPDVRLEVYDGSSIDSDQLLYASNLEPSPRPRLGQSELMFADHRWTLRFSTTPVFDSGSYRKLVPWVFGVGVLLSLALWAITAALARAHSDLQQAQNELRQHARDLERTVASRTAKLRETISELEHMSYSIVHDMRAPLRAIQSFGGMLEDEAGPALSSECRGYIKRMKTAASRLDALIRDVLNYGKIVRDEVPVHPVDLTHLVMGMVETYPAFQPDSADIELPARLPAVMGNEGALTQCFSNLLSNAVRFSKPGQKPKIKITAEEHEGKVTICVADEGIGIPKELQIKVFGMFQRLDNSHDGTGMGLAIVRKAAERMGGTVSVESDVGRGARFYLRLAAAKGQTPQNEVALSKGSHI